MLHMDHLLDHFYEPRHWLLWWATLRWSSNEKVQQIEKYLFQNVRLIFSRMTTFMFFNYLLINKLSQKWTSTYFKVAWSKSESFWEEIQKSWAKWCLLKDFSLKIFYFMLYMDRQWHENTTSWKIPSKFGSSCLQEEYILGNTRE